MASIAHSREGREKLGSLKGKHRKETPSSSTNREKARNESIMMVKASDSKDAVLVGEAEELARAH